MRSKRRAEKKRCSGWWVEMVITSGGEQGDLSEEEVIASECEVQRVTLKGAVMSESGKQKTSGK